MEAPTYRGGRRIVVNCEDYNVWFYLRFVTMHCIVPVHLRIFYVHLGVVGGSLVLTGKSSRVKRISRRRKGKGMENGESAYTLSCPKMTPSTLEGNPRNVISLQPTFLTSSFPASHSRVLTFGIWIVRKTKREEKGIVVRLVVRGR